MRRRGTRYGLAGICIAGGQGMATVVEIGGLILLAAVALPASTSEGETVMTGLVSDPYSSLQLVELSHVWGHGVPSYPGQIDVKMHRAVKHAQHGVLAWRVTTVMHTGTHMNAPIHLIQKGADLAAVAPDRLFGNGAVLDVPKKPWEVITAADLQNAKPGVKEGDIVVIVTGWHHKYSDALEYYGEAPGLSKEAAEWLVR